MTTLSLIFLTLFTSTTCWAISGNYLIKLQIGNETFLDQLILEDSSGKITGTYIVPNSFESEVTDFKMEKNNFSFNILVSERGEKYPVTFKGLFTTEIDMQGKAFFSSDQSLLGDFVGSRQ